MAEPETMRGGWVAMYADLPDDGKLLAMARHLAAREDFRAWMARHDAVRCAVTALLLRVWGAARQHGYFDGPDLVLPHAALPDLDTIAQAPGVGEAMKSVGWALEEGGVRFPNFKGRNPPKSGAERAADYRRRKKMRDGAVTESNGAVTDASHDTVTKVTPTATATSTEKSKTPLPPEGGCEGGPRRGRKSPEEAPPIPPGLDTPAFREAWGEWVAHRREKRHSLTPRTVRAQLRQCAEWGPERAARALRHSVLQGYQGLFEPRASAPPAAAETIEERLARVRRQQAERERAGREEGGQG